MGTFYRRMLKESLPDNRIDFRTLDPDLYDTDALQDLLTKRFVDKVIGVYKKCQFIVNSTTNFEKVFKSKDLDSEYIGGQIAECIMGLAIIDVSQTNENPYDYSWYDFNCQKIKHNSPRPGEPGYNPLNGSWCNYWDTTTYQVCQDWINAYETEYNQICASVLPLKLTLHFYWEIIQIWSGGYYDSLDETENVKINKSNIMNSFDRKWEQKMNALHENSNRTKSYLDRRKLVEGEDEYRVDAAYNSTISYMQTLIKICETKCKDLIDQFAAYSVESNNRTIVDNRKFAIEFIIGAAAALNNNALQQDFFEVYDNRYFYDTMDDIEEQTVEEIFDNMTSTYDRELNELGRYASRLFGQFYLLTDMKEYSELMQKALSQKPVAESYSTHNLYEEETGAKTSEELRAIDKQLKDFGWKEYNGDYTFDIRPYINSPKFRFYYEFYPTSERFSFRLVAVDLANYGRKPISVYDGQLVVDRTDPNRPIPINTYLPEPKAYTWEQEPNMIKKLCDLNWLLYHFGFEEKDGKVEKIPVKNGVLQMFGESYTSRANSSLFEAKALTPEEKMDRWHNGSRKENIKACSDEKLKEYRKICRAKGYAEEVKQINAELRARKSVSESFVFEAKSDNSGLRNSVLYGFLLRKVAPIVAATVTEAGFAAKVHDSSAAKDKVADVKVDIKGRGINGINKLNINYYNPGEPVMGVSNSKFASGSVKTDPTFGLAFVSEERVYIIPKPILQRNWGKLISTDRSIQMVKDALGMRSEITICDASKMMELAENEGYVYTMSAANAAKYRTELNKYLGVDDANAPVTESLSEAEDPFAVEPVPGEAGKYLAKKILQNTLYAIEDPQKRQSCLNNYKKVFLSGDNSEFKSFVLEIQTRIKQGDNNW